MITRFQKLTTDDRILNQIQDNIAKTLNPLQIQPINSGNILESVSLVTGANHVNHLLGRPLQGWFIVRLRALSTIYDTQDTNKTPSLTLSLVSSAPVTADLFVF